MKTQKKNEFLNLLCDLHNNTKEGEDCSLSYDTLQQLRDYFLPSSRVPKDIYQFLYYLTPKIYQNQTDSPLTKVLFDGQYCVSCNGNMIFYKLAAPGTVGLYTATKTDLIEHQKEIKGYPDWKAAANFNEDRNYYNFDVSELETAWLGSGKTLTLCYSITIGNDVRRINRKYWDLIKNFQPKFYMDSKEPQNLYGRCNLGMFTIGCIKIN
jgi:hypothetical protein